MLPGLVRDQVNKELTTPGNNKHSRVKILSLNQVYQRDFLIHSIQVIDGMMLRTSEELYKSIPTRNTVGAVVGTLLTEAKG